MSAPTTKAKVAFVVVGWNNQRLLKDCFDSVLKQTYPQVRLIYIDNNSSDGSLKWVQRHYPQVVDLAQPTNTGFAKGNNIGIKFALRDQAVEYVALLNTDARVDKNWTESIIKLAAKKPRGALFQGTTLDYYDHHIIDSTHIYMSRTGEGTQGNWRYFYRHEIGPKRVFGVNAAACMVSRRFIDAQPFEDLFDEDFFMYLEDVDLCTRAVILGWDSYLVPGARAFHMGSASSGKKPGLSLYLTFRNNAAVLFKNMPLGTLIRMFPRVVVNDVHVFMHYVRRFGVAKAMIVVKGRVFGAFKLPLYLKKRLVLSRRRRITKTQLWNLMRKGY